MANRTIADRIFEAHNTGKEAQFIGEDGQTYEFSPEGLSSYINTEASAVSWDEVTGKPAVIAAGATQAAARTAIGAGTSNYTDDDTAAKIAAMTAALPSEVTQENAVQVLFDLVAILKAG